MRVFWNYYHATRRTFEGQPIGEKTIPDMRIGKTKVSGVLRSVRSSPVAAASNVPLLEHDRARIAIIEPSRIIKPIDVAEHCVLCFFQEVIAELVREGAQARQVHNAESEAGDYPVYEMDYGARGSPSSILESALPPRRRGWSA